MSSLKNQMKVMEANNRMAKAMGASAKSMGQMNKGMKGMQKEMEVSQSNSIKTAFVSLEIQRTSPNHGKHG